MVDIPTIVYAFKLLSQFSKRTKCLIRFWFATFQQCYRWKRMFHMVYHDSVRVLGDHFSVAWSAKHRSRSKMAMAVKWWLGAIDERNKWAPTRNIASFNARDIWSHGHRPKLDSMNKKRTAMAIRATYRVWWQSVESFQMCFNRMWSHHWILIRIRNRYNSSHDMQWMGNSYLSINGKAISPIFLSSFEFIHIIRLSQGDISIGVSSTRITGHQHVWVLSTWRYPSIGWSAQIGTTSNPQSHHSRLSLSNERQRDRSTANRMEIVQKSMDQRCGVHHREKLCDIVNIYNDYVCISAISFILFVSFFFQEWYVTAKYQFWSNKPRECQQ